MSAQAPLLASSASTVPVTTNMNQKTTVPGGNLRKSMDRIVNTLERRIDQQIIAAQIRAYDSSPHQL
jgi:hypothetical protein